MNKIHVLDKSVSNRIAAGEVVEKPASVVKELIENSIDAGATRLTIEIEKGGISKISITDNGFGMNKDDLKMSILAHATSKIKNIDDLNKINSLGFRGEALSSIASVSQLVMTSATANDEVGAILKADGGSILSINDYACPIGTKIEVNNLFYNTPVRAKFLRKPKTEESDITDYIERFMLAYPAVSIKYVVDGNIRYHTMGGSLIDNIYTIYGNETASNVLEINVQKGDYKLTGYIGKPIINKANRNYQTLIVRCRYVKNFMISSAVSSAYDEFLMKGKFPFYVLQLELSPENLDVNIHPNKMEVKFETPNEIYSLFVNAVSNALYTSDQVERKSLIKDNDNLMFNEMKSSIVVHQLDKEEGVSFSKQDQNNDSESIHEKEVLIQTDLSKQSISQQSVTFRQSDKLDKVLNSKIEADSIYDTSTHYKQQEIIDQTNKYHKNKIIGTIFSTYIIIECDDEVLFIDQHAAHERILYDKFMKELAQTKPLTQELLIPFNIKMNDKEFCLFENKVSMLNDMGFVMEEYGQNTYRIISVPYVLSTINLNEFFDDILGNLNTINNKDSSFIKNLLATKACKSAVKAGQELNNEEISTIQNLMKQGILHCPHGRPFVISLTKNQFEKWFKRIV